MDVGVIGTGIMGKNHARIYSELKNVNVLSVYDIDIESAQKVADQYDAEVYASLKDLLEHSDVVSVCVPTQYHSKVVNQVFEMKKSVLIEKPICNTTGEARELMRDAPYGILVGVGHIERFNPIITEIKKIMRKPLYIEMKRHNPASSRVTGSTVVEDLMIHDIDIMIHAFFLPPTEIHSTGNDDVRNVIMRCGSVPVSLSASRKSSKKIRTVYIEEEDFTIEGDFMSQEITIYSKPDRYDIEADRYVQENIIEKVLVNKSEPLKIELSTFIDCVKNNIQFPISPYQAIRNLEICERILGE
jgi:predicted dehydrogenase